jgi:hypothetical protein
MDKQALEQERARFNALSPSESQEILAKAEGQQPDFRSCWYCNGAHQHLKDREVLNCFACGFYYLSGYPLPVVQRRADGVEISEDDMRQFNEVLESA